MEKEPIETNLDIFIEDEEKEKTKIILKNVFSSRLAKDFLGKQTAKDKSIFVEHKLPIYFDALQRGYKIITSQLQTKPKSNPVLNGLGIKNYTFTGEEIYWNITPKSEDFFEQAEFYQAVKNLDIQTSGITSIWTEDFLVEQILDEGLKQQDKIFENFMRAINMIRNIEQTMQPTTKHLNNPKHDFTDIRATYLKLMQETKIQDKQKDLFVKQYIIPNHPVISQLEQALETAQNIEILHNVFRKNGDSLKNQDRKQFENTIATILLTENLQENTNIWDPFTMNTNIIAINKFIKRIKKETSKEETDVRLGLIVYETIERQKIALEKLFQTKGIKPEIGIEFFQSILLQVLKELPEPMFLTTDENNTYQEKDLLRLRNRYRILDHQLGTLFEANYINILVRNGGFPEPFYQGLGPNKQKLYLQTFFQDKLLKERRYLEKNIQHLFKLFRMRYLPTEKKFGEGLNINQARIHIPSWKKVSQEYLIHVFLEQIDEGNQCLVDVLEEIITKDSFSSYIQKYNLPISNTEYSSKINAINEQSIKGKLKKDEALKRFIEDTAKYALAYYIINNELKENIPSIIAESIRFVQHNLYQNHLFTSDDIAALEQLTSREVENIINNFNKQNLPQEFGKNKLGFIKNILISSLQS